MAKMAKVHSNYVCQQCGYSQVGWAGKCPNCGEWGSLVETSLGIEEKGSKRSSGKATSAKTVKIGSVTKKGSKRITTKLSELDRVLGGGLVNGQVVLLAGEPGIGKSTILLQLADKLGNTLYVSGEESPQQIALRAQRLGLNKKTIELLDETDIDTAIATAKEIGGLSLLIIDSIQTMNTADLSGMAGSVGQVRETAARLVRFAKKSGVPTILVGHVTKQGSVAGPAVLAHIVDTVLWFEGDKDLTLRLLRSHKNRFGATDEVGVFEMNEKGLTSLSSPEKLFLSKERATVAGSVVSSMMQGTRPMLVEIQSLVVPTKLAYPKRVAQGIDSKRLELLLAVLTKRCGLPFYDYDVFVNVAGGINAKDPAVDLAIVLSLASSYFDKTLPKGTVAIGEVGLLGEIREVVAQEKRIKESRRLGYPNTISNKSSKFLTQLLKSYLR